MEKVGRRDYLLSSRAIKIQIDGGIDIAILAVQ